MTISHEIAGNAMQLAICELAAGQTVYSEAGKFLWKTTNVSMETHLTKPTDDRGGGASGLFAKAMDVGKRVMAGESLALQYYRATGSGALVSFAGVLPGEMRALELDGRRGWFAEKDAFIAAESTVDLDIAFTGLRSGIRGGEGFILEKFTGTGTVLIAGAGNFIELNPADYGGTIQVDTGCVVAFEDTVRYDVERIGGLNAQTLMSGIFGGEGLSLATLTGDGEVILQSMTMEGLSTAILKNARTGGDTDNGKSGLGNLFGGLD